MTTSPIVSPTSPAEDVYERSVFGVCKERTLLRHRCRPQPADALPLEHHTVRGNVLRAFRLNCVGDPGITLQQLRRLGHNNVVTRGSNACFKMEETCRRAVNGSAQVTLRSHSTTKTGTNLIFVVVIDQLPSWRWAVSRHLLQTGRWFGRVNMCVSVHWIIPGFYI